MYCTCMASFAEQERSSTINDLVDFHNVKCMSPDSENMVVREYKNIFWTIGYLFWEIRSVCLVPT